MKSAVHDSFCFKALLTESGWLENARVQTDADGLIVSVESLMNATAEWVNGYALPGFQNAHSHAFQYAMAGLAELHEGTGVPDDFWSWRSAMYNLALTISPEQLEAIATQLYIEMARHGYTSVAEFHYLHHDMNGKPYNNLAEMGERLISAAKTAGIHITLLPMFYQKGGFGQDPNTQQRRFISSTQHEYNLLVEASQKAAGNYEKALVGAGIHSLRAVDAANIISICKALDDAMPFHIHVAEQLKEIDDCIAFYGMRPVEWLMQHVNMQSNYHVVHATHLNDAEIKGIAASGAHVVLCPSTEGNLGDGLFRLHDFKEHDGQWSIGTDSHIGLNPLEELRVLDYGQRLITHKRTSFYEPGKGDSGFNAIKMSWQSGRKAMGLPNGKFFEIGQSFDAAVIDASQPLIANSGLKNMCNTIVYTQDASNMFGTISKGKWIVKHGKHLLQEKVQSNFTTAMSQLKSRL
jgi:formimidoylglutamate deiminase